MSEASDDKPPLQTFRRTWLLPSEARELLPFKDRSAAGGALLERAVNGWVRAVAEVVRITAERSNRDHEERLWPIPQIYWTGVQTPPMKFWQLGDQTFNRLEEAGRHTHYACAGLRFEPRGVQRMLSSRSEESEAPALAESSRRGPKGKPFWEAMWAEIAAQLGSGELSASKQTDIETAMRNWLIDNGHDASESTVRLRAQPLWDALRAKADNSPL
jgi:hypothetical protein